MATATSKVRLSGQETTVHVLTTKRPARSTSCQYISSTVLRYMVFAEIGKAIIEPSFTLFEHVLLAKEVTTVNKVFTQQSSGGN